MKANYEFVNGNDHYKVGITQDSETEEYKVVWRINGKMNPDWTYFTDDENDAFGTMQFEVNRIRGI